MLSPGPQELLLIFLFILLIFGGRRIPEIARGLGKGMREFKSGVNSIKEDLDDVSEKGATGGNDKPGKHKNASEDGSAMGENIDKEHS